MSVISKRIDTVENAIEVALGKWRKRHVEH